MQFAKLRLLFFSDRMQRSNFLKILVIFKCNEPYVLSTDGKACSVDCSMEETCIKALNNYLFLDCYIDNR